MSLNINVSFAGVPMRVSRPEVARIFRGGSCSLISLTANEKSTEAGVLLVRVGSLADTVTA